MSFILGLEVLVDLDCKNLLWVDVARNFRV